MFTSKNGLKVALGVVGAALMTGAANAQTITDGNATFRYNTSTTQGSSDFRPEGGTTTDHSFRQWWWFRVSGDTQERNLTWATNGTNGTPNGNVLSGAGSEGAVGRTFNWTLTTTVADGNVAGAAGFVQVLTVTNPGTAPLQLAVINYHDIDLAGTAGSDSAVLQDPAGIKIGITDGATTGQMWGVGADAYQVTAFATLAGLLTNGVVNDLNNTGLPFGPGDYTGGFQWNRTIGAGASMSFVMGAGINQPAVPAPGALALLGLGGLMVSRRRR